MEGNECKLLETIEAQYQELRDFLGQGDLLETLCRRIRQEIQEMIDAIPAGSRIAIRPCSADTKKLLSTFDFSRKNIVAVIDKQKKADTFCGYPCWEAGEASPAEYDCLLISSFYFREEIKRETASLGVSVLDPYALLKERGIELIAPFDVYAADSAFAVNFYYREYIKQGENTSEEALRRLLQAAVEQKDFAAVSQIYRENRGRYGGGSLLEEMWSRVQTLLQTIQKAISRRRQNDIFMFFADAVPACMLEDLPETKKLSEQGLFFQRAYTHTPYTNSTMRAVFRKQLPIDDFAAYHEPVNSSNSPLLQYLEGLGYCVLFSSYATSLDRRYFTGEYFEHTNCGIKWWDAMMAVLRSAEPCFCMIHFVAETHPPHISPFIQRTSGSLYRVSEQTEEQIKAAFAYFDQCLSLYSGLAKGKIQIFFSDHGTALKDYESWSEWTLHACCFAIGGHIRRQVVPDLFPYRNFMEFIQWLLEPGKYSLERVYASEVVFQDVDCYTSDILEGFIKWGLERRGVSYRGVLTDRYKFAVNRLGEEYFYRMDDGEELPETLRDETLRRELLEKCGTDFLDIYQHEKFRSTRKFLEYIKASASPQAE